MEYKLLVLSAALLAYSTLAVMAVSVKPAWLHWRIFPTRLDSGSWAHRLELLCHCGYLPGVWGLVALNKAVTFMPPGLPQPLMISSLVAVAIGGVIGMRSEAHEP